VDPEPQLETGGGYAERFSHGTWNVESEMRGSMYNTWMSGRQCQEEAQRKGDTKNNNNERQTVMRNACQKKDGRQ
jgi:hypothetical protein